MSLLRFISIFIAQSHCENLRDKIYGVQSLLPEEFGIDVDYGLSIKDTFMLTAQRWYAALPRWQEDRVAAEEVMGMFINCAGGMGLIDGGEIGPATKRSALSLFRDHEMHNADAQGNLSELNDESEWQAIESTLIGLMENGDRRR